MDGNNEIIQRTALELRDLIAAKSLSPVQVLDAFIARIESINPAINAVTATRFERARKEAQAAERAVTAGEKLGPLHGLPFAVKDLERTGGVLTTFGSPLYKDYVPDQDTVMVSRLRQAGAIMVGKTNTPEFGSGANTRNSVWGATGNPFNPMLTCGGSSGGSAAALAADLLPICTGSDTGGSLRIPASFCGVVGFRPSTGMVPAEHRALAWTPISVLGPMARNVPDTRLLLASQIGANDGDPFTFPQEPANAMQSHGADLSKLRVGYSADFGTDIVDKSIVNSFNRKIAAMRGNFAACEPVSFDFGQAERCFDVIRAVSYVSRYKADYDIDPMRLGPNVRANYELGADMSLADFSWAHTEQSDIFRRFQRIYDEFDVIVSPSVAVSPFPWEQFSINEINGQKLNTYYHWLAMAWYITLTTNPAISLPCGLDDHDMPFGLQVVGKFRGDYELLDIAEAMENAFADSTELARPLPDISALSEPVEALHSLVTEPPDKQLAFQ